MQIQERDGLIIWLYHTKHLRILKRYGYLHYVSKRMKYAVLYCNHEATNSVVEKLSKLKFVRKVDYSHLQEIKTTYENGKTENEERDSVFN
ncbi:YlbG family protein [Sporolactobacillus sp. THM19-2]|uniref:YlbG family protein n=1 Tax=Sporolactobacillus sp. THM19-2 TaxID=2511171 RepID=UPI00101F6403|nr:YlbG family protein [Sporolactobacillus sp. THM19-2]RYL92857.1 DUF2129 domain-containing protein [Sporolactobacillus sp. THM19-2]